MSTTQRNHQELPRCKQGLNSRYWLYENEELLKEAEAEQDWFDRVNQHTELNRRLGGLYYEFSPVTPDPAEGRGIIIDNQQVFSLEDMR